MKDVEAAIGEQMVVEAPMAGHLVAMGEAAGLSPEEICASIDADSLAYISLEQLVEATTVPSDNLCRACFDGVYPVELPEPELLGKHLLEATTILPDRPLDVDGLAASLAGGGAADALERP